jgi:hypothetical protein
MGQWKKIDSPKLGVPLEMREMTIPGAAERIWEVQELRMGAVFKVTLTEETLQGRRGSKARKLSEAEAERAVCLSIEEALVSPPDKEPGMTYDIAVSSDDLMEAVGTSG